MHDLSISAQKALRLLSVPLSSKLQAVAAGIVLLLGQLRMQAAWQGCQCFHDTFVHPFRNPARTHASHKQSLILVMCKLNDFIVHIQVYSRNYSRNTRKQPPHTKAIAVTDNSRFLDRVIRIHGANHFNVLSEGLNEKIHKSVARVTHDGISVPGFKCIVTCFLSCWTVNQKAREIRYHTAAKRDAVFPAADTTAPTSVTNLPWNAGSNSAFTRGTASLNCRRL